MKRINVFLAMILLVIAGCAGGKQSTDDIVVVDVTNSYPQKELILQDLLEVEYIPLETTDEFLCQGVILAIGKNFIIVKNQFNDGDIFVFDRNGKGLNKINHRGQGGEEYLYISEIALDEANGEMFVNDFYLRKIMVYDLNGMFKRSFQYAKGAYSDIYNFDSENLICYDATLDPSQETGKSSFFLISKQHGSIVKDIQICIEHKKAPTGIRMDGGYLRVSASNYFPVIPYRDSWILTEYSSDTVIRCLPDYSMIPFIERTPSIQTMSPEVLLYPGVITDRYLFMKTVMNEVGAGRIVRGVLTKAQLVYDKKEHTISEYTVINDDYTTKQTVDMAQKTINNEIAYWQKIEAYELVESNEKGELKGTLKEIAAGLDAEDNAVIMIAKHKR